MYQVDIEAEACVLTCEITALLDEPARLSAWASDREALGYRELEFRVIAGEWFDPGGAAHDLGRNGCTEVAERYADYIEEQLWRQLDAQ